MDKFFLQPSGDYTVLFIDLVADGNSKRSRIEGMELLGGFILIKEFLLIKVTLSSGMFSFFSCSANFFGVLLEVLSLKIGTGDISSGSWRAGSS